MHSHVEAHISQAKLSFIGSTSSMCCRTAAGRLPGCEKTNQCKLKLDPRPDHALETRNLAFACLRTT